MIKEAIEKIIELSETKIKKINDRDYSDRPLSKIKDPSPEILIIHTLSGLVSWLHSNDSIKSELLIGVADYNHVAISSLLQEKWCDRHHYIKAKCENIIFPFNQYLDIESFIIKMQCGFVDTENKKNIIDFLSNIAVSEVTQHEDDGLAQEVVKKNKVGRLEKVTLNPMIELKPYRTFLEVEQPESLFLLRLQRTKEDQLPLVALFEADGGRWKLDAIKNIDDFLRSVMDDSKSIHIVS